MVNDNRSVFISLPLIQFFPLPPVLARACSAFPIHWSRMKGLAVEPWATVTQSPRWHIILVEASNEVPASEPAADAADRATKVPTAHPWIPL